MPLAPSRRKTSFFKDLRQGEIVSFHLEVEGQTAGVSREGELMCNSVMKSVSRQGNPFLRIDDVHRLVDLLNDVFNLVGWELCFEDARNADGSVNEAVTHYWTSRSETVINSVAHSKVVEVRYMVCPAEHV